MKIERREIRISLWIRKKRLENGLTQQKVADALKVNVRAIRRWESEENRITDENLMRIAKLFGYRLKNIGDIS